MSTKKAKKDKACVQFVEKLEAELEQTESVFYSEFKKNGEDDNFNIESFEEVGL